MGLFDTIREKAAELLSGVTEKAGDLAGDLPGAETLNDLSQSATDEAAGTVQDLSADATQAATDAAGSVTDATDTVTGPFTDAPDGPPRPQ